MIKLDQLQIEQVSGGYKSSNGEYCGESPSEIDCCVACYTNIGADLIVKADISIPTYTCRIDDRFKKKVTKVWYTGRQHALDWKKNAIDAGCKVTMNG